MRLSLSLKFGLLSGLLVLLVAGSLTYLLVFRFGQAREREMIGRDRELARVLAGLRDEKGHVDFDVLTAFVRTSDKVETGLVYALQLDARGKLLIGALNPRLFAGIDPRYRVEMRAGRKRVLDQLAGGKIAHRGVIKEFEFDLGRGKLRLGFDLGRIDRLVAGQRDVGLLILGIGLLLGVVASVLLARNLGKPIGKLAAAMEAVAGGDLDQTVQVGSSDELASLAGSFNQMMQALRASQNTQRLAGLYLSEPVAQRLAREEQPLALTAEERAVTVGVFELQGVTEQLARGAARQSLALVNAYLSPLLDAVLTAGGVVLQLGPARVQALWGAFGQQPEPDLQALRGASEARDAIEAEARRQQIAGEPGLQLAVGLASGQVVLGNVGSAQRLSYAAIGRAVELARRIAEQAQPGQVLLAEQTYRKVAGQAQVSSYMPLMLEDGAEVALYIFVGLQR